MNSNWQEFLSASGARIEQNEHAGHALVSDFGDFPAEQLAAREATVIAPLVHLGLLECAGEDAKSFLQNQLTSNINHMEANAAQLSAWCTAKGRMLASFYVFRNGADYRAVLSADRLAEIQKRLQIYVLRSKVKIADLSNAYEMIGVSGAQAELALQKAGLPSPAKLMESTVFAHGTVIRIDITRLMIVVASDAAPALWKALAANARPVGSPVWAWLDIQAGVPLITEATKEAFIPQMANFDQLGGVSFNKGCYPGQEIVARTKYLGKVKRHLYRAHADVPMSAGDWLCSMDSPETACGMIANAAPSPDGGFDALAVIQESFVESGNLHLGKPDGAAVIISTI